MGYAGMISSALGGVSSNFMSIATADSRAKRVKKQYETQARLAEYNRQLAENNAISARQDAKAAVDASRASRDQAYSADKTALEHQKAFLAKSGVTQAGTPLLVQQDQLAETRLKENDIIYKGKLMERQDLNRATNFQSQADMAQYQANVARATGKYKSKMIKFQKKLTIAKMFYDGANVTSFGQVDNPSQFKQFDMSTLSSIGANGGKGGGGNTSNIGKSSSNPSAPTRANASGVGFKHDYWKVN